MVWDAKVQEAVTTESWLWTQYNRGWPKIWQVNKQSKQVNFKQKSSNINMPLAIKNIQETGYIIVGLE